MKSSPYVQWAGEECWRTNERWRNGSGPIMERGRTLLFPFRFEQRQLCGGVTVAARGQKEPEPAAAAIRMRLNIRKCRKRISDCTKPREAMETFMGLDRPRWASMSHEDRLKEAAMAFIRLCAEQGEGDSPRKMCFAPQLDPYTRASVASLVRPTLPVKIRHLHSGPTLQAKTPEEPRVARKPIIKRKVLRRRPDGEVEVTDESITSTPETSSQSDPEYGELSQRMHSLKTQQEKEESEEESEPSICPESETAYSWITTESQSQSSQRESQSRSSTSYEQDLIVAGHPKSFILPRFDQLSRNRMKTDRVARYLEHKHDWESLRLPGEDPRKGVRWSIREQMLCKSELPPRAQHIYIPNNYLVPTEKKRSALRWGIRCDLANGVMPRNTYSS
nr:hydrolethalus syndrome protein 1 isoform X1 [Podarcis muralis]